jgi:hypothetical protein
MKEYFSSLILSISSFSGVILCYLLIRQDIPYVSWEMIGLSPSALIMFVVRNTVCIFGIYGIAYISTYLAKRYFSNTGSFTIAEIKPLESVAVPTYIGLFVVSMGVASADFDGKMVASGFNMVDAVGVVTMLLLFIFWRKIERILYFNPIWLLLKFRFYEIKAEDGGTYTLITRRQDMKNTQYIDSLLRINNYTYMEIK